MKRSRVASTPDEYVRSVDGWRRRLVESLRRDVRSRLELEEVVKWGHLVYLFNGPVCLIRIEDSRVLLGFWRGQRLRDIEPGLKPGGKYEMATLDLREGTAIEHFAVQRLVGEAIELNRQHGDPAVARR